MFHQTNTIVIKLPVSVATFVGGCIVAAGATGIETDFESVLLTAYAERLSIKLKYRNMLH